MLLLYVHLPDMYLHDVCLSVMRAFWIILLLYLLNNKTNNSKQK